MARRAGDWDCSCGERNFASRSVCRQCGLGKGSKGLNHVNRKLGDWTCSCNELNFASRVTCHRCNKLKEEQIIQYANRKPGDWDCDCGEMNFASRTVCRKCNNDRIQDWECPCGELNTGTNIVCRSCTKSLQGCYFTKTTPAQQVCDTEKVSTNTRKPGDWNCDCGEMNFASRSVCRKCNRFREGVAREEPSVQNKQHVTRKPGDWTCSCGNIKAGVTER